MLFMRILFATGMIISAVPVVMLVRMITMLNIMIKCGCQRIGLAGKFGLRENGMC